jgi:DNA-binding NtrC family response regulator
MGFSDRESPQRTPRSHLSNAQPSAPASVSPRRGCAVDRAIATSGSSILLAEDESNLLESLAELLRGQRHHVTTVATGKEAVLELNRRRFDLLITDMRLPEIDGMNVVRHARDVSPETLILVMTGYASLSTALEAMRAGVTDYLQKPIPPAEFLDKVGRVLEQKAREHEIQATRRRVSSPSDLEAVLVARSPALRRIRELIAQVATTNSTVLITGETGVGKDVAATAVHQLSASRNLAFLPVNCGAIPDGLLESQLFGHVRGAFTGADSASEGLFRRAEGGTVFFDEVGELPLALQAKLLRAIDQKEILPVGSSKPIKVRVRLIASTNRDLAKEVAAGRFREDLYYRLKVVTLAIPPLRERPEDLPPLVEHLVQRQNVALRRSYRGVSNETMALFISLPWPGNARELDHVLEYAMIVGDGEWIRNRDLPTDLGVTDRTARSDDPTLARLESAVRQFERSHIIAVLGQFGRDRRAAARHLGIHPATLYRKIQDLQILLAS